MNGSGEERIMVEEPDFVRPRSGQYQRQLTGYGYGYGYSAYVRLFTDESPEP
jgi:hypothetical protein